MSVFGATKLFLTTAAAKKKESLDSSNAKQPNHNQRLAAQREGRRSRAPLPEACLERVLCCLAEQAEAYGPVGPSMAARDIANASLASWCVVL
jgi:hypothetical protein